MHEPDHKSVDPLSRDLFLSSSDGVLSLDAAQWAEKAPIDYLGRCQAVLLHPRRVQLWLDRESRFPAFCVGSAFQCWSGIRSEFQSSVRPFPYRRWVELTGMIDSGFGLTCNTSLKICTEAR